MEGNWPARRARLRTGSSQKGYRILDANYRTRFGEIDIIAEKKPYIIFVEVKTRGPQAIASPMERLRP